MIAQKCPNISEINLDAKHYKVQNSSSHIEGSPLHAFTSLAEFTNLREVVSTSNLTQWPKMRLLGRLPDLNSLTVRENYRSSEDWDPLQCEKLSSDAFPRLTDLDLELATSEHIKRL